MKYRLPIAFVVLSGLVLGAAWYFSRKKKYEVVIPQDKPGAFVEVVAPKTNSGATKRYAFDSADTTFSSKKAWN